MVIKEMKTTERVRRPDIGVGGNKSPVDSMGGGGVADTGDGSVSELLWKDGQACGVLHENRWLPESKSGGDAVSPDPCCEHKNDIMAR